MFIGAYRLTMDSSYVNNMHYNPPPQGGGGITHNIFGWGCSAQSWKALPYFRPKYKIFQIFHTLFQTRLSKFIPYFRPCEVMVISETLNGFTAYGTSWRPKRCSRFFSSRSMSTAKHVTLKMVSQTKQTQYTPYFRPKWQNLYPISD